MKPYQASTKINTNVPQQMFEIEVPDMEGKFVILDKESDGGKFHPVRLEDVGEFSGIILQFETINLSEDANEDGTFTFSFDYDILFVPESIKGKEFSDEQEEEFDELIGDIIKFLIMKNETEPGEIKNAEN